MAEVFICYARKDNPKDAHERERWVDRLIVHLKPIARSHKFTVFHDDDVQRGDQWHQTIQGKLNAARVVVLVVSPHFLNSEYITAKEMPVILRRHREEGLHVIPIHIEHSIYDSVQYDFITSDGTSSQASIGDFQGIGVSEGVLNSLEAAKQEKLLTVLAKDVQKCVAQSKGQARPSRPAAVPTPSPSPLPDRWTNSLGMIFVPVPRTDVRFGIWPVRVQDYAAYAKANPNVDRSWENPQYQGVPVTPGPEHPVVNVSWNDATAFCQWLTQHERRTRLLPPNLAYRLPTDLEWSAAVGLPPESGATPKDRHGQIPDVFPWGSQWPPPPGSGNFADESFKKAFPNLNHIQGYEDGFPATSPVGRFKPSQHGLYDLAGNVWEWCEDWYDSSQKYRVVRGGSWGYVGRALLLSSSRYDDEPYERIVTFGFRVVLGVEGSAR